MYCRVNLGYGIGSAIVLPNGLYYGVSGTSGEIGHIIVETMVHIVRVALWVY